MYGSTVASNPDSKRQSLYCFLGGSMPGSCFHSIFRRRNEILTGFRAFLFPALSSPTRSGCGQLQVHLARAEVDGEEQDLTTLGVVAVVARDTFPSPTPVSKIDPVGLLPQWMTQKSTLSKSGI